MAHSTMVDSNASLQDLLKSCSDSESCGNLLFYSLGNNSTPNQISIRSLYTQAKKNSELIRSLASFRESRPVLLHLEGHWENILWFWSVLLADGLPVLSSPLSNIEEHRQSHLQNLSSRLESPLTITSTEHLPLFDGCHTLEIYTTETLHKTSTHNGGVSELDNQRESTRCQQMDSTYTGGRTPAFLMLTSGSTGDAKAVCLTHHQVLTSVKGKASVRRLSDNSRPFLNWIGLDHVASLVEIHLQALWLNTGQIHVHAADIIPSPSTFLGLLSKHCVARSFAPNFFLAKLALAVDTLSDPGPWDLSNLEFLASGGEANDAETCVAASAVLRRYGARNNVIVPGFGMTETCAGAIFNLESPDYDIQNGLSICCLGKCIPGIEMRVVTACSGPTTSMLPADEVGDLELRGDIVFDQYYRDPESTRRAFTPDGWFRTGDQAKIDPIGNLHLCGRLKDVFNLNGVKFSCAAIQLALEQSLGPRVARVLSFPSRAPHTEQITVACIPHHFPISDEERVEINDLAVEACLMCSGHQALSFCLEQDSLSLLPTTTLGKISRAKMRSLFESGRFDRDLALHRAAVSAVKDQRASDSSDTSEGEAIILKHFAQTLGLCAHGISVESSLFDIGCTSMDLVRLKRLIDTDMNVSIPIVVFMKHPTARSLATALGSSLARDPARIDLAPAIDYDPVITLRAQGKRTPLWLVHPGVGEILVFVGLSQHMNTGDRPIYALRARGFEPGQACFSSIAETVETYVNAIRLRQPCGPYAIAGYSYGTMLAFEIAKVLDSVDGESSVRFLGSFNLPPHIKTRMRHLNWNMCLLHLAYFLNLTTEEYAEICEDKGFRALSRSEALTQVLQEADEPRMEELGLGEKELVRWADVAFSLQVSALQDSSTSH